MAPEGGISICKDNEYIVLNAYKASCLATDGGESVDDLDYGTKGIDQLAMFVPIDVEFGFSF